MNYNYLNTLEITKMKKQEIAEDRQRLIQHLQQKINQLKAQRTQINMKIQGFDNQQQLYKDSTVRIDPRQLSRIDQLDRAGYVNQKNVVSIKLGQLQQLYEYKRQLSRLGIQENDPAKIKNYINEPYIKERIQLSKNSQNAKIGKGSRPNSAKKKMNSEEQRKKQQKQQVLNQELAKIQKLLNKKRATKKQVQQLQELNYQKLFESQLGKRKRFEQLLKKRNSLSEKQQLLQMVFDVLKQLKQKVKKQAFSGFLLANPNFAKKFFITEKQVYRDLDVYETEDKGFMSFNQFYEFIKSIELTNPQINPALKNKTRQDRLIKKQNNWVSQKQSSKLNQTKGEIRTLEKYLKKLFSYLDKKKESVIPKQLLVTSLSKAFLLKKQVKASKEKQEATYILDNDKAFLIRQSTIQGFIKFMDTVHPSKNKKSFYKELQLKFVGIEELLKILRNFQKECSKPNKDDLNTEKQNNNQNVQEDQFKSQQQQISKHIFEKIQEDAKKLQEHSEQKVRYPWQNQPTYLLHKQEQQLKNPLLQLKHLDDYYKQLRNRHANEIEWGNLKNQTKVQRYGQNQILAQFKDLQERIKQMERHQI